MLLQEAIGSAEVIESAETPSLVPDRSIDLNHLTRICCGDRETMAKMLRLFDIQADILLARMMSEDPKTAAARARTLAGSARAIGAGKVAELADGFEQVALRAGPVMLASAVNRLSVAVTEAQVEIGSLVSVTIPQSH